MGENQASIVFLGELQRVLQNLYEPAELVMAE
jgi:hypothetical protein